MDTKKINAIPTITSDGIKNIIPASINESKNKPDILMEYSVAVYLSNLYDKTPLKTRPPSIGNAGIILKKHIQRFFQV